MKSGRRPFLDASWHRAKGVRRSRISRRIGPAMLRERAGRSDMAAYHDGGLRRINRHSGGFTRSSSDLHVVECRGVHTQVNTRNFARVDSVGKCGAARTPHTIFIVTSSGRGGGARLSHPEERRPIARYTDGGVITRMLSVGCHAFAGAKAWQPAANRLARVTGRSTAAGSTGSERRCGRGPIRPRNS